MRILIALLVVVCVITITRAAFGDDEVGALVKQLKDKSASVRAKAAEKLAALKDAKKGDEAALKKIERAVKSLIDALRDKDSAVRSAVAAALKKITEWEFGEDYKEWLEWWKVNQTIKGVIHDMKNAGEASIRRGAIVQAGNLVRAYRKKMKKKYLGELFELITMYMRVESRPTVREVCAEASVSFGERAIKPIIASLKSDKLRGVRAKAAAALGKLQSPDSSAALREAARSDKWSQARKTAIESLARLKQEQANRGVFLQALKSDKYSEVRAAAVCALAHYPDTEVASAVVAALGDTHSSVRKNAAITIAKITGNVEPKQAVTAVKELKKLFTSAGEPDETVRRLAIAAFASLAPRCEGGLDDTIKNKMVKDLATVVEKGFDSMREAALDALGFLNTPDSVATLKSGIKDQTYGCQIAAAQALARLGIDDGKQFLLKELSHKFPYRRLGAIDALVEVHLASPDVIAQLKKLAESDTSKKVKERANKALDQLTKEGDKETGK